MINTKIIERGIFFIVVFLALSICNDKNLCELVDKSILFEEKNKNYVNIFNVDSVRREYVFPSSAKDNNINYFINAGLSRNYDLGFRIQINEDGSLTFVGTNKGKDISFRLSQFRYLLEDGLYYIDDCNTSEDGFSFYIEGWNVKEGVCGVKDVLAMLPNSSCFLADSKKYNQYWYGIRIKSGFSSEGLTIYPSISKKENVFTKESYASQNVKKIVHYDAEKKDIVKLKYQDWILFFNTVRYQYFEKYDWCTISLGNGYGFWFEDCDIKKIFYGKLDSSDRVIDKKYLVKDTGKEMVLVDLENKNVEYDIREII